MNAPGGARPVLLGYDLISPLGVELETQWQRAVAGENGVGPLDRFAIGPDFPVRIAGQVPAFDAAPYPFLRDREMAAWTSPIFRHALLAPGEVVRLVPGRGQQPGADRRVAGRQRLPVVERLGRDLAGVVHPHQPGRVAPGRRVGHRFRGGPGRVRAGRRIGGGNGAQRTVQFPDQGVGERRGTVGGAHRRILGVAGIICMCAGVAAGPGRASRRAGRGRPGRGRTGPRGGPSEPLQWGPS